METKADEAPSFDFETPFLRYPRKEGKKRGMEKLRKTIKSKKRYDQFVTAMDNYIALCVREKRDTLFIKIWVTFCNNWEDYLIAERETAEPLFHSENQSQLDRILKGEL